MLEDAIRRINPKADSYAIAEALNKIRHFENNDLVKQNALFMDYIQNGVEVTYSKNGETKADIIYLVDYKNVENNSFIFANQWTFIEKSNKRPDVLLFLNGLPICLFELKSPSREETDASEAYLQIRNYMLDIIKNFICFNNEGLKKLQDSSGISPVFRSPQGNCPYGTGRAGRCENRRFLAYAGLGQITQHGILCTPVAVDD